MLPFTIFESKLPYCKPFRNASLPNEGHFDNLAQNWLPWQRPLRNQKSKFDHLQTNTYLFGKKIVKIGPVDPVIPLL